MPQHSLAIVPLKITEALPAAGLAHGGPFYLVYEHTSQRFHVVWWEHLRWHCSCTRKQCAHAQAVSAFLLEETRKRRITEDDLEAHVEDDLGLNRE